MELKPINMDAHIISLTTVVLFMPNDCQVYVKRLEELQKTGNVVVRRDEEWRNRPRAFEELARAIVHYEKILTQFKDEVSGSDTTSPCTAVKCCSVWDGKRSPVKKASLSP